MLIAIIVFLVFVALFTLAFRQTTQVIGQRVGEWVDRRHRAAEEILESGRAPAAWVDRMRSRFPGIASGRVERAAETRVRRALLRELGRLERYFRGSPLVDSDQTREALLAQLRSVRESWRSAPLADVLARAERQAGEQAQVGGSGEPQA